jgi:hypothetical protein
MMFARRRKIYNYATGKENSKANNINLNWEASEPEWCPMMLSMLNDEWKCKHEATTNYIVIEIKSK